MRLGINKWSGAVLASVVILAGVTACKPGAEREGAETNSPTGEGSGSGAGTTTAAAAGGHQFDPGDRWSLTGAPVKGAETALVTIVEFSDFQCPFCSRATPTIEQILATPEFAGKVRVVFMQLPLGFHDRAEPAARAALAAHAQGKFWEFHDLAFANQRDLTDANFTAWATQLGLDVARFTADYNNPATAATVAAQLAVSERLGIRGTPNFMVNGRNIVGAQGFDAFATIIREEITAMEALVAQGKSVGEAYGARLDANVAANAQAAQQEERRQPPQPDPNAEMYVPVGNSPFKGSADALVTIAIFSDFQCPFCSRVNPTIDQILTTYGNDVRVVWKQLPLGFHDRAEPAARASIAAANQGKFWEYHDLLFANQRALTDADLESYATQLGLNIEQWRTDLQAPATTAQVQEDTALAERLAARGTPHFFVNGYRLRGAQPFEAFQAQIDRQLEVARALVASGTPRAGVYDALQADAIRGAAPMLAPAAPEAPAAPPTPVPAAPTAAPTAPTAQ